MRRPDARWWRGVPASILVLGSVAAKSAESPSASSPLSAAAKEFQELGKLKTESTAPKPALRTPDVPSIQPTPDAPRSMPAARQQELEEKLEKQRAKSASSANWLVDAMMKDTARDDAGKSAAELLEEELRERNSPERLLLPNEAAAQESSRREPEPKPETRPEVTNPLSAYMSSWMTPRDFELLGSTAGSPASGDLLAKSAEPAPVLRELSLVFGSTTPGVNGVSPRENFAGLSQAQREVTNPFLAEASPPLAGLPSPSPSPAPASPPPSIEFGAPQTSLPAPIGPAISPAVSETPQAPRPSELLRGNDDAKYFRQLKRF